MLATHQLSVGYAAAQAPVLAPITLQTRAGSFVCALGRNGAGKSTLLRTLAGLQPPLGGSATLQGQDIGLLSTAERAQRIAVVLTERASSPGLTADDVVALGRQPFTGWTGRLSEEDQRRIDAAFARAGAAAFRGRHFDDLSDGERQRVMIARAMAQDARLMLLDEITAFLDLPGRVEVMTLLRDHARTTGACVILSSHDLDLSLQLADTIWLLEGSSGFATGTTQELVSAGAIGRAFDTREVVFSERLGRFELRKNPS